jgi:multisubunit Na+/H+ antiporter MnhB subunit
MKRMNKYNILMKLAAGVFGVLFLILIVTQLTTIIPFQYAPGGTPLVVVPLDDLLQSLSESLWGPRLVDTLAQVVLLFVAAAGAAALFRIERRASVESEAGEMEGQE